MIVANKRPFISLIAILLLAFTLRLHALDNQSLWWDELKTMERATLPLPNLLADFIRTRDQLPAYYLLMRGWIHLGNNAFVVRFFSVLWSMLGVTAVFQLGRQIGSTKVGLTAAFLLAISPFHIYYSQEARMYSLLVTLLIFAHIGLVAVLQGGGKRYWLLYFLAMGTAVYTHYFTFLIIFAHTIFFILHLRPLKPISFYWFGLMTLLAALFVPWIIILTGRSGYSAAVPVWINTVQWFEPILTLWTFTIGATLSRISLAGIVGFTIFILGLLGSSQTVQQPSERKSIIKKLLLFWLLVPLFFTYLISLGNVPFSLYLDRYLIVVLPIYLLLVAKGWVHLTKNHTPWLLMLGLIATAVSIPSLLNLYNNPTFARNDWQETFSLIGTEWQSADVIIGTRDVQLPLDYYGRSSMPYIELPPPEKDNVTSAFSQAMATQLEAKTAVPAIRFWFIEPFYIFDTHLWPATRNSEVAAQLNNPHHQWLNAEFTHLQTYRFPGVRLTLYQPDD